MSGPLTLPFPPPDGVELQKAYKDLYLSANGDEATKKQLGNPANLPRPWDPPTCLKPELRRELWAWLDEVVTWFNHEYVWDHNAGMIPACWPQHPHLVHEIAVLADQRRRASLDPTSSALEEWHRYSVPGFLERLKTRTKNSCDEHHSGWPASGRHDRHVGKTATTDRQRMFADDLAAFEPHDPDPGPPGLQPIRRLDGRLVNPVTGEIL